MKAKYNTKRWIGWTLIGVVLAGSLGIGFIVRDCEQPPAWLLLWLACAIVLTVVGVRLRHSEDGP